MVKQSFDLNVPKDSSNTDEAAQNGKNIVVPLSQSHFKIHHGGCFTPTPSRSYVGGQISSFDVVDIDEFCLHDLKDMEFDKRVGTDLNEILGDYANTRKQITGDEITRKQMVVNLGVGPIGKFKEVEVDVDNESEEKSDTEGNDTSSSDLKDLNYDLKHDQVLDDDEHIVEDVPVSMNNFSFTADPKHDLSIGVVEVQEHVNYMSLIADLWPMRDHIIKTLATNLDIHVRAIQDQVQKQFDVGVSKMKAFMAKRIATDKMAGCPWSGQILIEVGVDENNKIYPVAYVIVEAESKRYCVRNIHENMKSQFKGGMYKEMLWNAAKANSVGEFNKKMAELKSYNYGAYDCRAKLVQKVIAKTVGTLTPSVTAVFDAIKKRLLSILFNGMEELTRIPCKHVMAAIYNTSKNAMGVGIPELWVAAAYRFETWAHVYSFKINPCNGREMWLVVESTTVIIPPNYKPQGGRPPKKRKNSHDEIARKAAGVKEVQVVGARNVPGQAAGARNTSSQASGSSQPSAALSTSTGARNASS
ncbi:hypothetical protein Tco_1407051 [Tanacetum coccineum]